MSGAGRPRVSRSSSPFRSPDLRAHSSSSPVLAGNPFVASPENCVKSDTTCGNDKGGEENSMCSLRGLKVASRMSPLESGSKHQVINQWTKIEA